MKTNVSAFVYNSEAVRTLFINGEVWFVATDICRICDIKNHRDAVSTLDEDEKGVGKADTLGGQQDMVIVSESGMYALTFKSRKAEAKKFRKWVTSVVLPSLRKTGSYSIAGFKQPTRIAAQNQLMKLMDKLRKERQPTVRRTIYVMLEELCQGLQMETPPLDSLGRDFDPNEKSLQQIAWEAQEREHNTYNGPTDPDHPAYYSWDE